MASGKLILKGKLSKKGEQMVYIYLTHKNVLRPGEKKETLILTPLRVNPKFVSPKDIEEGKLRVTKSADNWRQSNLRLIEVEETVKSVVEKFKFSKPSSFTVEDMRKKVISAVEWKEEKVIGKGWTESFDDFIAHKKATGMEWNTLRVYSSTKNELEKWLKKKNMGSIAVNEFTPDILNDYFNWMISDGYEPSIISKRRSHIVNWCHWAKHPVIDKDWKPNTRVKRIQKMVHFLTKDEVMQLYNYQPALERLQNVKDIFFRMVASGVRWSDKDLKNTDIITDRDGHKFLRKRNQKNGNISTIPLTPILEESMKKKLPDLSQAKFNLWIKELCELAKINTLVVQIKSGKGGTIEEKLVPKHDVVSSKIGRKTVVSLLKAQGLTDGQVKAVIGNVEEIEAYEGSDLSEVAKKMKGMFNPVSFAPSAP